MAYGKSKKFTTNPKKKGKKCIDANDGTSSPRGRSRAPMTTPPTRAPLFANSPPLDSLPNPNMESLGPASFLENAKHLLYPRYKESTKRFKERVLSMVPSDLIQSDSVSELTTVANYIAVNDLEVEPELLSDLKNAIRGRKHVAMVQYGGGDARHEYCIRVLEYCWSVLSPHRKKPKLSSVAQEDLEEDESEIDTFSNRFAEFRVSGDDTDDDDDEDNDLPVGSLPCPEEPDHAEFTLFELVNGTDQMNILLFLETLDDLMSCTAEKFAQLKNVSESVQEHKYPTGILVQHLIEASVAANFAIQQVVSLEEVFVQENPHLNTVYRVFAALIFTEMVTCLTVVVLSKSPIASQFSKEHAIAFVGDAIERVFAHMGGPRNSKFESLVKEFQDRWQLPRGEEFGEEEMSVENVFDHTTLLADIEARLSGDAPDELVSCGIVNPMWLHHTYIGQNRSITHTIRLIQIAASMVSSWGEASLRFVNGYFGAASNDVKIPASTIQFEMDALLMEYVLPALLNLSYVGGGSRDIPFQDTLFATFGQLKDLIKNPDAPVSWSLAFSVHSILTAVFEVQGSNHLQFIGDAARDAFEKYFQQIKWVKETQLSTIASRPPPWDLNVKATLALHNLLHVTIKRTEEQTFLPLWSPLCAGAFLSYLAYYGNVAGGSTMIDMMCQLRMTLHLFNALKQVQAIQPGEVEVLDLLLETTSDCKRTWNGPLPRQGQFQNRWKSVALRADDDPNIYHCQDPHEPFTVESISKSFHPICLHDFRGINSKKKKNSKQMSYGSHPLGKYESKLNHMCDAMKVDQGLLGMNTFCLAHFLNQFCIDLFVELGCASAIERFAQQKTPKRRSPKSVINNGTYSILDTWTSSRDAMKFDAMLYLFSSRVMRPLDAGDASLALRCAEFMKHYFYAIPTEKLMWFTSIGSHEMEVWLLDLQGHSSLN